MFAVDAEHEHRSVLRSRKGILFAVCFGKHNGRKLSFQLRKVSKQYLRFIALLLADGDLISEDGSVVLDHHSLFLDVPRGEQTQAL